MEDELPEITEFIEPKELDRELEEFDIVFSVQASLVRIENSLKKIHETLKEGIKTWTKRRH